MTEYQLKQDANGIYYQVPIAAEEPFIVPDVTFDIPGLETIDSAPPKKSRRKRRNDAAASNQHLE